MKQTNANTAVVEPTGITEARDTNKCRD